jgi:hypothetical protein
MLVYQRVCCKKDAKLASGLEAQKPKNPFVFELCKAHVVSQHLHIFFKVSQPHRQRAAHMLLSLLCVCPPSFGFEIVSVQLASAHLSLVCLTFSPTAECFGVFSHSKGFGADRSSSKTHSPKVPRFQVKVPRFPSKGSQVKVPK